MCVKCRINGELCCGRRCTRGAWSASRCCMDLGAGETACVPPGSESCWIHALLCAVCHREGVFVCADRPPGIPFARRTVDMNNSKNSVRTLTMLALLVAMSIVFSRVLSISTGFVRFNLGSLPVLLAALLFGPGAGFAVGAVADMIGGVLAGYAINPLITLGAGAIGLVAGLAWRKLPGLRTGLRLQISVLLGHFVGSMVITSLALRIFYGYPWATLAVRIPNALILAAVNTVLLRILLENRTLMKMVKK